MSKKYHAEIWRTGIEVSELALNKDKEEIVSRILLPFLRKQVVLIDLNTSRNLINMSAVSSVKLYRSDREINEADFGFGRNGPPSYVEDCTDMILNEIQSEIRGPDAKSLLELSVVEPENFLFVIMQFDNKDLKFVHDKIIKPLAAQYGLRAIRVDEIEDSGPINDQILELIARSKIIIADLTGERPNCYYEAGFAHAMGKEIILTIKKGEKKHFDLANHRFIEWEHFEELEDKLKKRFSRVSDVFGLTQR
ncbi:hypothetical protein [Roseivirga sp. E12]|uniref:hypothetical protein n=1 Tax=Roseivirga sp. E12 TaxID=2819237 RepID=UPI001ABD159C|nr:hypothetical protein [Roseivirga sp. E12]MBO3697576.1 hypothetical protein [Roseivirga sp. E12]